MRKLTEEGAERVLDAVEEISDQLLKIGLCLMETEISPDPGDIEMIIIEGQSYDYCPGLSGFLGQFLKFVPRVYAQSITSYFTGDTWITTGKLALEQHSPSPFLIWDSSDQSLTPYIECSRLEDGVVELEELKEPLIKE